MKSTGLTSLCGLNVMIIKSVEKDFMMQCRDTTVCFLVVQVVNTH